MAWVRVETATLLLARQDRIKAVGYRSTISAGRRLLSKKNYSSIQHMEAAFSLDCISADSDQVAGFVEKFRVVNDVLLCT